MEIPNYVIGVDPGRKSAFSVWVCSPRPVLVGCGRVGDHVEKDQIILTTLRAHLVHRWSDKGLTVAAVEWMPVTSFRSGLAAAGFHESRGRWRSALRQCGIITPIIAIHVATWRARGGLKDWGKANGMLPKKPRTEHWKATAIEYATKLAGADKILTRDPDLAEAICIGHAAALGVFYQELPAPKKKRKKKASKNV